MGILEEQREDTFVSKIRELALGADDDNFMELFQCSLLEIKEQRIKKILKQDSQLKQCAEEEEKAAEIYFKMYKDLKPEQIDKIEDYMLARDCLNLRTSDLCYIQGVLDGMKLILSNA